MYTAGLAALALITSGAAPGEVPPEGLVRKLTEAVRKHCPDAKVEMVDGEFVAKHGTMEFTVHRRSKSGEVFPATDREEGPNFRGFLLRVSLHGGKYEGAAVTPQTLHGPYFPTFIDSPAADGGRKHYLVRFSYGSRLDPDLKKAVFDSLPSSLPGPKPAPAPETGGE